MLQLLGQQKKNKNQIQFLFSDLVIARIKYTDKSNLREAGRILVHSFRKIKSVMEGRTWQQTRAACWQEPEARSTLLKQRVDRRQASYKASRLVLQDVSTSSPNSATSWGLRLRMCNSIRKHFKFNPLQGVTSKIYYVKLY